MLNRTAAMLIATLVIAASTASGSSQEFRTEWFACEDDSQCVVTGSYCGGNLAINKDYWDIVNKNVREFKLCFHPVPTLVYAGSECKNNKCAVVAMDDQKWHACKQDTDCVLVPASSCFPETAVSLVSLETYKAYISNYESRGKCMSSYVPGVDPTAVAKCIDVRGGYCNAICPNPGGYCNK